jgi:mannose-6-phosphate isomerase
MMECMATSDNVIRAGLTPKLRDLPNLISGLTYAAGHHSKHVVTPQPFSPHTAMYDPPIPEFAVLQVVLKAGEKDTHRPLQGPSIAAVCEGNGAVSWGTETLSCSSGDVLFLGAGVDVSFSGAESGLTLYRAFVEA